MDSVKNAIKTFLGWATVEELFLIRAEAERLLLERQSTGTEAERQWFSINALPYMHGRCIHGTLGCAVTGTYPHTECTFPREDNK